MSRPEFLLFGDSLTQLGLEANGWVTSVANAYSRKIDVINRGYSGYNSRWARNLFTRALKSRSAPPILLTIWLGANDAALPDRHAAFQHVPVDQYQASLQSMVEEARGYGVKNILLITPPTVDDAARITFRQAELGNADPVAPERTSKMAGIYAEACKRAGQAAGVPVLDTFSGLPDGAPDWKELFFSDGLHFTPIGQQRIFKLFALSIATHFPQLRPDSLPRDYPDFTEIDPTDPVGYILKHAAYEA